LNIILKDHNNTNEYTLSFEINECEDLIIEDFPSNEIIYPYPLIMNISQNLQNINRRNLEVQITEKGIPLSWTYYLDDTLYFENYTINHIENHDLILTFKDM
jgi:hypothetical protein